MILKIHIVFNLSDLQKITWYIFLVFPMIFPSDISYFRKNNWQVMDRTELPNLRVGIHRFFGCRMLRIRIHRNGWCHGQSRTIMEAMTDLSYPILLAREVRWAEIVEGLFASNEAIWACVNPNFIRYAILRSAEET